jgi:hypothetical protein
MNLIKADQIIMAQDIVQQWAVVNTSMNLRRYILIPSSGFNSHLNSEDGGSMYFQNISSSAHNQRPKCTFSIMSESL